MALSVRCTWLARYPMWLGKFLFFPPILSAHFMDAWASVVLMDESPSISGDRHSGSERG